MRNGGPSSDRCCQYALGSCFLRVDYFLHDYWRFYFLFLSSSVASAQYLPSYPQNTPWELGSLHFVSHSYTSVRVHNWKHFSDDGWSDNPFLKNASSECVRVVLYKSWWNDRCTLWVHFPVESFQTVAILDWWGLPLFPPWEQCR